MANEGKVILEDTKPQRAKSLVAMTIIDIPMRVHKKVIDYKKRINHERKKNYNLKQAYREFLIEKTK